MLLTPAELRIDCEKICQRIEEFIKRKVEDSLKDGVIIGLSGGLDSSVVAVLATRSLGKEKVWGLTMPERDSSPLTVRHAKLIADNLKINWYYKDFTPILRRIGIYRLVPPAFLIPRRWQERYVRKTMRRLEEEMGQSLLLATLSGVKNQELARGTAYYRAKHRLRTLLLYYFAERENLLVIGTGNKTELWTGFFVSYGDLAAEIMPLGSLYKTQVREIAYYLGVPEEIVKKPPSPDLIPGLTDEEALGLSYEKLDLVLYGLERGISEEEISRKLELEVGKVVYLRELMRCSEQMRKLPQILEF